MRILLSIFLLTLIITLPITAQETPPETTGTSPRTAATLLPDISVIGNLNGFFTNREDSAAKDHFQLEEIEVVLGSGIYPGVRGDLVLAMHGPEFNTEVEEGYLTVEQFTPRLPVGGRAGIVRLPFGKVNALHPHQLPTIDAPTVINNLVGEFRGNGFELIALPPLGNTFLQAQLGRWTSAGHGDAHGEGDDETAGGAGFGDERPLTLGRIWTGFAVSGDSELEFGVSGAFGHGEPDEATGLLSDITLLGGDITWRRWLPGERRLLLQGEGVRRKAAVAGESATSHGYYLLGAYRTGRLYEFGARYDWSQVAAAPNHESYVSAFATRFLNETTFLRAQVKHGRTPAGATINEFGLQLVFGFGPHSHVLQ